MALHVTVCCNASGRFLFTETKRRAEMYQTARLYVPGDNTHRSHSCENLKSHFSQGILPTSARRYKENHEESQSGLQVP
jgi:hypothetical protein